MRERPRWVGDLITVGGIAALFGAVYLLPPDTSLAQVKQAGVLRVCVPTLYPPLVTGKPEEPGFDVEFAQAIAKRLDVRIVVNPNAAMGRDFNPRNWNVTRAQCQMLAGGVVVSYFEWVQNLQAFFWEEVDINHRLENLMRRAYDKVHGVAVEKHITLRQAAYSLAVDKVAQATQVRGIYP